jgi:hypothetical protein
VQPNNQQLPILEELFVRLGLREPWLKNVLDSLRVHWNEKLYTTAFDYIMCNLAADPTSLLLPFNLPSDEAELIGDLNLGYVIGGPGIRFKHPTTKLSMHVVGAGSSGSGKTIFGLRIAEEALLAGINHIRVIDPKADEYIKLAQKHLEFIALKWKELRFNPLVPPPNVPHNEWYQTIVGHLAQTFNFWQGGEALILHSLTKAYRSHRDITFRALLLDIYFQKQSFSQKDAFVISTVTSRLKMLLDLFGDCITTNSDMLERLCEMKVIISTTGLMTESESWFVEFLLLWEYMYRVFNPGKRQLALHIYDECQHRLFSSKKESNTHNLGASLNSQLVDQARALNISICSLSQEPSTLIKPILNNSYLKVAFHLGSGTEVQIMKQAMGLDDEQANVLHYLETGEAIVRTAGGYMDAMPVKIDNFISSCELSDDDFLEHQKDMKEKLYQETISKASQPAATRPSKYYDTSKQFALDGLENSEQSASQNPALSSVENSEESPDKVLPVLQVWLNLKKPFLLQGAIFEKAGITSGSGQAKIKNTLKQHHLIVEHKLQVGKTYASVWEPTSKAYEVIEISKPQFNSKGGYLHQFIAHHISEWATGKGYLVEVESQLSNGKAVDLILRKDNKLVFIEIAISEPLEKEISNIIKDFGVDSPSDRLILVVKDGKSLKKLAQLIDLDDRLKGIQNKVEVGLACSFMSLG